MVSSSVIVIPDSFNPEAHYYPKTLNATTHPQVSSFFNLNNKRIVDRYCHLHPQCDRAKLIELLSHPPIFFRWSGADLFYVTKESGNRSMVLIETNSCPSGQKSMPLLNENDDSGGYRELIEKTIKPILTDECIPGVMAVIYDKNYMEASGYAAAMADVFKEPVYLVEFYNDDPDPMVRWQGDVMQVKDSDGHWIDVKIAFRYVTQKPWNRFPVTKTKTIVLNPVIACLAGGRNKLTASKSYEFFNAKYRNDGLAIRYPETIRDVNKSEIPLWVSKFGGNAVIKNPYSNAGQGVYTITSPEELDKFMTTENTGYDQYIVQSLIGNYKWSSVTQSGQFFHVGTIPDKNGKIYCADLRMMIHYDYTTSSWRPLAIYSRKAAQPLPDNLEAGTDSWQVLGTNLSYKTPDGKWGTDMSRLLIMDRRDFNRLGLGVDDLIDAYIQTVLATLAIDDLANELVPSDSKQTSSAPNKFNIELFQSLNKDDKLMKEIMVTKDSAQT